MSYTGTLCHAFITHGSLMFQPKLMHLGDTLPRGQNAAS